MFSTSNRAESANNILSRAVVSLVHGPSQVPASARGARPQAAVEGKPGR